MSMGSKLQAVIEKNFNLSIKNNPVFVCPSTSEPLKMRDYV